MRTRDAYVSSDDEMAIPVVPGGAAPGAVSVAGARLTADELRALDLLTEFTSLVTLKVIGNGETRTADCREFVAQVHTLQATIMSNAAARAYPDRFRTLGGTI